ncbi:tRNA (adenosine(37)-N6)-threonylcarbamoyltransferase complex dimerization subunit type 1 TsaB [Vibrio sp. V27_P1S3P104]|uniref:tRNA (adenosine(37)-N6)-threonylcarbamoyltransferase complex dimerization subunit type 1 TsaB n=1 Tax=unclassified Vibrio TaxID=2614977 RepID=UPI0013723CD4|nr:MULTISPECIES: tRNA (adenosine(37)-N6)-threonylcarbamoyltransferase complex dimerization subunit type 1 TsaB [unclassified Vibrio]NAW69430.1 tRNA (adenosine(37)-N6)-threonylcarbamoyltransferase complex dimerization subunit type 1 TsaB [Vibrio sp. V28_P6S34P95]NAX05797.1 tRNA (adenosine(37)-N6)-threonylcarbamoyltransferase complex dimerization subunit type 1 TsaB [Vibrio sp. V30_P3S12P165]NAX34148.1 tRNA (adenosine(37)-N6)-threonylcarbamoyltransferase complex dimerization subunit type 1 TsaB [V
MSAKILALDTATEACSVALMVGEHIYSRSEVAPRDHTKKILPMVDEVLKEAGLTLQELDALAFGRGPGSFTGVRIGIGIAQGLGFGADLPMIGVSTLAALAQGAYREQGVTRVACAIDARMGEVYWARFERQQNGIWLTVDTESVVAPQSLLASLGKESESQVWSTAGTGWAAYQDTLSSLPFVQQESGVLYPQAQDMVVLAYQEWQQGRTLAVEETSPIYLRDTVAWKKLPGRA